MSPQIIMAIQRTEAIVLRRQDLRETSLIANFYTRDFGKVTGVLKGIRTEPGKFASSVELFSYNEIIFYEKRNSAVHLISQCDLRESFTAARQNIVKSTVASVMMELTSAIMGQEDKNEEVFDLALSCLRELEKSYNAEKIMTIFKIKILSLSGFEPHFDSCVVCDARMGGQAKFSLGLGGLLCPKCFYKDQKARTIFRGTIATLLHIQRNTLPVNLTLGMNPEIKKELEIILNAFIQFHLEKELKSQRVLSDLTVAV